MTFTAKKNGLSRLQTAIGAAALLTASGFTVAAPISLNFDYTCGYPLIGVQPLNLAGTADIPTQLTVGDVAGPYDISVIAMLQGLTWTGLNIVSAATLQGTVNFPLQIEGTNYSRTMGLTPNLDEQSIPPENGDFPLNIEVSTDPIDDFDNSNLGAAEISMGDFTLNILAHKADGSAVIFAESDPATGIFPVVCILNPGQDNVVATIEIIDAAVPPIIETNPAAVNFGTLDSGLTGSETIAVSNDGGETLVISSITLLDNSDGAFMTTDDCTTVEPGESCDIDVTYFATGDTTNTAQIEVMSNATMGSKLVDLTGSSETTSSPDMQLSSPSVNFGTIGVGTSTQRSLTISNVGSASLEINSLSFNGSSDFTESSSCASIASDSSCTVTLTYSASGVGSESGTLNISSNDGSASIALSGAGEVAGVCDSPIVCISFDLMGETFIANAGGTPIIEGSIAVEMNLAQGIFAADLMIEPTYGDFPLLGTWLGTAADIDFAQVGRTTGTLTDGILVADSEMYILLTDIYIRVFGLKIRIGGGDECSTKDTAVMALVSPSSEVFDPLTTGGSLHADYFLPNVEHCGPFTFIVNIIMAGDGNTIDLQLTP